MADNTYRSYRNRDEVAYDSDGVPARGPADPLAQLARLIGQNDPRTEFDHNVAADAAPQEWPTDEQYAEPNRVAEQGYDERYDERYDPPRLAEPPASYRAAPPSRGDDYVPHVPQRSNNAQEDARFYAPVEPRYPVGQQAPADYGQQLPAFAAQPHDDYDYDDREQEEYYAEDEEQAPSGRRRGGLVIVAAVLGLAVLGTAGAFAYRAMFGGSMMPSLPPIIKADTGPNKIVPNATNAQGRDQANANTGALGEKVVSREEQPVDVPAPAPVNNGPRVVSTIPIFPAPPPPQGAWASGVAGTGVPSAPPAGAMAPAMPAPGQAMSPQAMSPMTAPPPPQAPTAVSTEPKKIHTVAIKPDQAGAPDAAASAPAPRAVAAPKPAGSAPHVAMAAAGGGPMSIVPTQGEAAAPAPVRTHTAVAQPMAPAAAPSAWAPSPAAGGGYAVQLTSQRSEAEAQSAFRSLAAKYPTQLGGQQPIIRQADLGTKGIYYRALVGPFASMEQATGLCSSLKAAGGNCIVQRN